MPDDKTIDFVVAFVSIGLLALGLGSVALGWVVRVWDRVKTYRPVMSRPEDGDQRTERTNERTNERSSHDLAWQAFLLDRTRMRLIEVMVDSDMTTTDIRTLLKGESKAIGDEVEAARLRLGKASPDQYRTPIVGRPTGADFRGSYQPPP